MLVTVFGRRWGVVGAAVPLPIVRDHRARRPCGGSPASTRRRSSWRSSWLSAPRSGTSAGIPWRGWQSPPLACWSGSCSSRRRSWSLRPGLPRRSPTSRGSVIARLPNDAAPILAGLLAVASWPVATSRTSWPGPPAAVENICPVRLDRAPGRNDGRCTRSSRGRSAVPGVGWPRRRRLGEPTVGRPHCAGSRRHWSSRYGVLTRTPNAPRLGAARGCTWPRLVLLVAQSRGLVFGSEIGLAYRLQTEVICVLVLCLGLAFMSLPGAVRVERPSVSSP